MQNWTTKRKASFWVHTTVVAIPLVWSTVSAFNFWASLFNTPWLAAPMVAAIEILALLGFVLFIVGIQSPFTTLRHALPFISVVPLMWELYTLLQHNGLWIAIITTVVVAGVLIAISWQCFSTIERLFINPVEAARERALEQLNSIQVGLMQAKEIKSLADSFIAEYSQPVTLPLPATTSQEALQAPQDTQVVSLPGSDNSGAQNGAHEVTDNPPITSNKSETVRLWKAANKTVQDLIKATGWPYSTVGPLWNRANVS